jgi:hypothetical protein
MLWRRENKKVGSLYLVLWLVLIVVRENTVVWLVASGQY